MLTLGELHAIPRMFPPSVLCLPAGQAWIGIFFWQCCCPPPPPPHPHPQTYILT